MKHRLKTTEGKVTYAKRKCTVEPVFGIIKSVLGHRQFLRRGIRNAEAEWSLIGLAWNLKRMHVLAKPRPKKAESAAIKAKPALQGLQKDVFRNISFLNVKNEFRMFVQTIFKPMSLTNLSVARSTDC